MKMGPTYCPEMSLTTNLCHTHPRTAKTSTTLQQKPEILLKKFILSKLQLQSTWRNNRALNKLA
jgi:hypothetical protein